MAAPGLTPFAQKAIPLAQRSIAFGSLSSSYAVVGSIFSQPVLLVLIVSTYDHTVQCSWDGVDDHFVVPAGSTIVLDFRCDNLVIPGDYGVYVKTLDVPTAGSLYVSAFSTKGP